MATLGSTRVTLVDVAKELDPDGSTATIVDMLSQDNEILQDMTWVEGNLPTGHRTTIGTSLPTVGFRRMNEGAATSKATSAQVDEATAEMVAEAEVDKSVADLNGAGTTYLLNQSKRFFEAMSQKFSEQLIYGNAVTDEKTIHGFAPRYASYASGAAINANNMINGGGAGSDNTSIWLIGWDPEKVTGIYPKGTKAGIQHMDMGIDYATDANGNRFLAYRDHYQWNCGLMVADWRQVVRICNVDASNLDSNSSAADLIVLMMRAMDRMKNLNGARFYVNRKVKSALRVQSLGKSSNAVKVEDAASQFDTTFFGIPVRTVDQLLNTEAAISFA